MRKLLLVTVAVGLALWCAPAQASSVTLTSGNSSATIQADSTAGMNSWVVDGVNQLYQQWFFFRIGSTGDESGINALSLASVVQPLPNIAIVSYTGQDGLNVAITYTLTGGLGGTATSDIAETIAINNSGRSALDLHFFQYSDFDLNGTPGGDTVQIANPNSVTQSGENNFMSETVITPPANFHAVGFYPDLLNLFSDGLPTTLDNSNGPLTGDVSWAFQWDDTLGANGTFIISKDKQIRPVPEPGSMLLLGTGLFGLAGVIRRRFTK
jgi:hypothetical protein